MTDISGSTLDHGSRRAGLLRRGWPILIALALLLPALNAVSSYLAPPPAPAPAFDPAPARGEPTGAALFRDQRPLIAAPAARPSFELPQSTETRAAVPVAATSTPIAPPTEVAPANSTVSAADTAAPASQPAAEAVAPAPVETVAVVAPVPAVTQQASDPTPAPEAVREPPAVVPVPVSAPVPEPASVAKAPPAIVSAPPPDPSAAAAKGVASSAGGQAGMLTQRGQTLLQQGDIAGARLFLRRATEVGSAQGALLLGSTFDATWLATRNALGVTADKEQARRWYREAERLGASEARDLLARLDG